MVQSVYFGGDKSRDLDHAKISALAFILILQESNLYDTSDLPRADAS
jgi:hypothetical protein